jgi:hypothetical protein
MEGDSLAQVEGVLRALGVHFPVMREIALGDQLRVDVREPAQDVRRDLELQNLIDLRRVDGPKLADARPAGAQRAARLRPGGRDPDAGQEVRGGQCARGRQEPQDRPPLEHRAGKIPAREPHHRIARIEVVRSAQRAFTFSRTPRSPSRMPCADPPLVYPCCPRFAPRVGRVKSHGR